MRDRRDKIGFGPIDRYLTGQILQNIDIAQLPPIVSLHRSNHNTHNLAAQIKQVQRRISTERQRSVIDRLQWNILKALRQGLPVSKLEQLSHRPIDYQDRTRRITDNDGVNNTLDNR